MVRPHNGAGHITWSAFSVASGLDFLVDPFHRHAAQRHLFTMLISVPNYHRRTDRLEFGTLIGITSESVIDITSEW